MRNAAKFGSIILNSLSENGCGQDSILFADAAFPLLLRNGVDYSRVVSAVTEDGRIQEKT